VSEVDTAYTVDAAATQGVCFAQNQIGEVREGSVANTLNQNSNASGRNTGLVRVTSQVRRITPIEAERLQGFPDDYTNIPWRLYKECQRKGWSYEAELLKHGMHLRGPSLEDCPDGPRYKALGNSFAVPVVHCIGRRIQEVSEI
jgi:DNA (cytosine-5)-methyltransferase 1